MTRSARRLSQPGEPVGDRVRDVHLVPVLLEIDSQAECKILVSSTTRIVRARRVTPASTGQIPP